MKVAFCLLLAVAAAQAAIYCPSDACERYNVECDKPNLMSSDCGADRFVQNGGICGCCPVCIKQINVDENCAHLLFIGGVKTSECAGNLKCNSTTKKCDYGCRGEAAQAAVLQSGPRPMVGVFNPRCEDDGSYSSYQCQGSGCYCVAKDGTKIDGYSVARWMVGDMNCNCARAQHEYSKLNIVGKSFDCESNGNYKKIQCSGSVCYCAGEDGKQLLGALAVHISAQGTLTC